MTIQFYTETEATVTVPLTRLSDPAIERSRKAAERQLGRALPLDPRTEYPNFVIYDRLGYEIAGG